MNKHLMAAGAAAAVIGGAAALGFAGVANAGTPQEDAVVAQMDAAGFHHNDTAAVIGNAHHICEEIGSGKSKSDVAVSLGAGTGIGPDEAFLFVDTAIANLCP